MDEQNITLVAKEVGTKQAIVEKVIDLLKEGNTVPSIARYRKEITNGLDEIQIKSIQDKWTYAENLRERKEEVLRLIEEQDKLTPELKENIQAATQLQRVEDLYRPYKQKRRTKATIAKEKGLEPLAIYVWQQEHIHDLQQEAEKYLNPEQELDTVEACIEGVNDIIAEWVSDEPEYRTYIRKETLKDGRIETKLKKQELDEKHVYEMYYDYSESIRSTVSHRILAMNRAEKENVLKVTIQAPADRMITYLNKKIIKAHTEGQVLDILKHAISDGYKRLIEPSIEREIRNTLTEKAEAKAIDVFSVNLKNLLLQPPLKGRTVLGVDPAFRTGCKLAVIDETGKVQDIRVIYPTAPKHDVAGSEKEVLALLKEYSCELIAIGNGTA